MAKELLDYLAKEEPAEPEAPVAKPDLGEKRLMYLAEATGVSDPAALVKLVKACLEQYKSGGPPSEEE